MTKTFDQMSVQEQKAYVASLEAQMKANRTAINGLSLQVGKSGGLSIYGLGRFPVTLYSEQWRKLLAISEHIEGFLASHANELKVKPAKGEDSAKAALVDSLTAE